MKKVIPLLAVIFVVAQAQSQFVYKIKADSVLITNDSCTAELILENSTKHIKGFLYNKGNGRTEFRQAISLNDSTLVFGDDTLVIRGSGGSAWKLTGNAGIDTAVNFIGTTDSTAFIVKTNNIERMRVQGNGRVGIGTNTPTTILDVNGPMKIFGSPYTYEALSIITNANNFQNINMVNSNTGSSAGSGGLFKNDINHAFQFYMGSTNNAFVPDGAEIRTNGAGGMNICSDSGIIAFGKSPFIGVSEYARFVKSGNFGIGTQTPQQLLHVKNTASCCGAAIFEANFEAVAIKSNVSNGFAGMRFYNHNGNTFAAVTGRNSDNALQIIADSSYISFWTGSPSSQRMDIIPNGNVGIGISTPAYNLDVNGKVGIHTIDSSSSPSNLLYQDPSTGEIKKTAVSPYKKYVALLSQTGSNAPTATILENTLGGTITWSRNLSGNYTGTLTGAFTANKTWFHVTPSDPAGNAFVADMARVSANTIGLITKNDTMTNVDGWTNISIEIRVYP